MTDLRNTPVKDIMSRWPETASVLARYRIDLCCGGHHTLKEVAEIRSLDLEVLVKELEVARNGTARR